MPIVTIQIPPGVVRQGTGLSATGRWIDSNLVRWRNGVLQPIGGWRARQYTSGGGRVNVTVSGRPSGMHAWRANNGDRWAGVGTHTGLYAYDGAGAPANITPTGYVAGRADAQGAVGYGSGAYGASTYGTPRPESSSAGVNLATTWSVDNWGEDMLSCASHEGKIYEWSRNPASAATVVSAAPTGNTAIIVTAERFVFALGAGGNFKRVEWCDRENYGQWTPATNNQAGGIELQTPGRLRCGTRTQAGTLLLTDTDAHLAVYQGPPFVYGFTRVGQACGTISALAVAGLDASAVWMGEGSFFLFDGYVRPLPCDVADLVFNDMNQTQTSKICAVTNAQFQEVVWFYPSAAARENDRYVAWNYGTGEWAIGSLSRSCAVDQGVFPNPVWVSPGGTVYDHETGWAYDGAVPFVESAPLMFGDTVVMVRHLIPDEKTQGDVQMRFRSRFYPNGPEQEHGPYALVAPTSVRFTGRQIAVRIEGVQPADWRVGDPRLDIVPRGTR